MDRPTTGSTAVTGEAHSGPPRGWRPSRQALRQGRDGARPYSWPRAARRARGPGSRSAAARISSAVERRISFFQPDHAADLQTDSDGRRERREGRRSAQVEVKSLDRDVTGWVGHLSRRWRKVYDRHRGVDADLRAHRVRPFARAPLGQDRDQLGLARSQTKRHVRRRASEAQQRRGVHKRQEVHVRLRQRGDRRARRSVCACPTAARNKSWFPTAKKAREHYEGVISDTNDALDERGFLRRSRADLRTRRGDRLRSDPA